MTDELFVEELSAQQLESDMLGPAILSQPEGVTATYPSTAAMRRDTVMRTSTQKISSTAKVMD